MDLLDEEIKLIDNYLPTLKRYYKNNIDYKYFKITFSENYIYKLTIINEDEKLISKIIDKINNFSISNEDIFFSIKYYYNFNKSENLDIQKFLNNDENETIKIKFNANLLLFNVKYYQYYYIINELIFEKEDDNELFYAIYLFIKNDTHNLEKYIKKYFKMKIFFYLLNDLSKIYKKNIEILEKNEIISKKNYHKMFIKNIFSKWNTFYIKMIDNNNFNEIETKFQIKKNIFYKLLCNNNLC